MPFRPINSTENLKIPDAEPVLQPKEEWTMKKEINKNTGTGIVQKIGGFLETSQLALTQGGIQLGIGAAKGVLSTGRSLASLMEKGLRAILPKSAEDFLGLPEGSTVAQQTITEEMTKPSGMLQTIGKTGEQIGEYFVGGALKIAKVPKMITTGLEFAGRTFLQTGEPKKAAEAGAIGLAAGPITKTAEAILYPVTQFMPKRIMSVIFKTAKDDLRQAWQTIAKGEKFNPTLAEEVLARGLKGSPKQMGVYCFQKLNQLENQVQIAIKDKTKQIIVENKKAYVNLLNTIKNQFKGGFFSERAKDAETLIGEMNAIQGKNIAIDTTLKMRRFIDNMRNTSSFRLDPSLSARQEEFKVAADLLRKKLANAGLKDLMNEERIYIEALDSIVSDAVKRQNRNVIGLVDILAGGGGMVSGAPLAGISAAAAIRGFQQPFTLTNLAQFLYKFRNVPDKIITLLKTAPPTMINQ